MENLTPEEYVAAFQPAAAPSPLADTAPEPVELVSPVILTDVFVQAAPLVPPAPTAESVEMAADAVKHVESAKALEARVRVQDLSDEQLLDIVRVPEPINGPVASQESLDKLKGDINDSFAELSNVLLDIQRAFDLLLQRIDKYNERSSHKI
jgi:hypothetical protein